MSSQRATKYVNRSPRYILQVKDNAIVRFAGANKGAKRLQTKILNLSETGMAFLLPYLDNPKEGEMIKVEFQVPNSNPIACFARVVRIETHLLYSDDHGRQACKLVAVSFHDLPVAQREFVRQGLGAEFNRIRQAHVRQQRQLRAKWLATRALETIADFGRRTRDTLTKTAQRFFPTKNKVRGKRYIDEN